MTELTVYSREGSKVNTITVDNKRLGDKIHHKILRDVVVMYESSQRKGTASTKTRSEVSGSSRKPWAQKHIGRARVGTIRSPIWRHGGTVFGPKPRDFSYRFPKKTIQRALNSAILSKMQSNKTVIVDSLTVDKASSKEISKLLKSLKINSSCLIGVKDSDRNLYLSSRNVSGVTLLPVKYFNAHNVMKHKNLILTKDALEELTKNRS